MRGTESLEKTLMQGKIEDKRKRGWQRIRWLDGILTQGTWIWTSFKRWWWTRMPGVLQSMPSKTVWHNWAAELNFLCLWFSEYCQFDLWFLCIFEMYPACTSESSLHILLKPILKKFEYYLASMWNKRNYMVVWTFFGTAFLWDWN